MTKTRFTYENIGRVVKIEIAYDRGIIDEGTVCKVYRVGGVWTPSGHRYAFLVWSKKMNKCVWVRCDEVNVAEWSKEKIHEVG